MKIKRFYGEEKIKQAYYIQEFVKDFYKEKLVLEEDVIISKGYIII